MTKSPLQTKSFTTVITRIYQTVFKMQNNIQNESLMSYYTFFFFNRNCTLKQSTDDLLGVLHAINHKDSF